MAEDTAYRLTEPAMDKRRAGLANELGLELSVSLSVPGTNGECTEMTVDPTTGNPVPRNKQKQGVSRVYVDFVAGYFNDVF